jgi:GNAT-family acetyltransferase (TIGR03103 family)
MLQRRRQVHRLNQAASLSLRSWEPPSQSPTSSAQLGAFIDVGWGRVIFGHTFESSEELAAVLRSEADGTRDIALYLRDPHVLLALAPDELFLDPSHTYRLWSHDHRSAAHPVTGIQIRRLQGEADAQAVNRIYGARRMVPTEPSFMTANAATKLITYFVAESVADGQVIGTVTGVDHVEAFGDPERGASLWCLAVDPQANVPGVGQALVRHLVGHYFTRGRAYVDLSVMHDNTQAIKLYEKLGFRRVPVFCVKRKNPINEPLFTAQPVEAELNVYAKIIVDEALRRGIGVDVLDADLGYFRLSRGGRSVVCRESLSELTSAIAMSRCDDKRLTHRLLERAGLRVPAQHVVTGEGADEEFFRRHERVVVKPARGEQGAGVSVDLRSIDDVATALTLAGTQCPDVLMEEMVPGVDLRVIVIDFEVVATAVRYPPKITGNGIHDVRTLIEKYNRRRSAATRGESAVPIDGETERCVRLAGWEMDQVPPSGEAIAVRKTANLHTGGTIHDVTDATHPDLVTASVEAARALDIPVVGLDLAVPRVNGPEYAIIEANERPGLANHEPQPTAERFIDLLFPRSAHD